MAPAPEFLPIRLRVVINGNITLENVAVKAFDNMNDFFSLLEPIFEQRGDPVLQWNRENLKVRVNGPLVISEED